MTSILKVDTIQDTDGNNIINENSNTITIGASGDTTNIVGTLQNNGSAVGGDNTPAWRATNSSSNQSISHDSTTKLTFTEEVFDTDSAYDATNSKFVVPSGEGGKYLISMKYEMEVLTNPTYAYIYVNGSATSATRFKASSYSNEARMIVTLSAGDYVEGYTYQASGGSVNVLGLTGARGSVFEGYKLIGV